MTFTFGGLASGLDTNSIVTQLVAAEHQPIDDMAKQKQNVDLAKSSVSAFSSKLSTLQSAAAALADAAGFAAFTVSSSDPGVVATMSGSGAAAGAFDVSVSQLAQEQRSYSDVQTSDTASLGISGDLSLQVGTGAAVHVTISTGDSLAGIAAAISSSGARVSAAVVYDGKGYYLQVRGLDTGADNAIAIGESGFTLGLGKTPFQPAQDAKLSVDGIDITRPTNLITGVVPGVSLALGAKTTTASKIRIGTDSTALKTKIGTLVTAYNDMVANAHMMTGYGGQKATNPILSGDFAILGVARRLGGMLTSTVAGTSGAYTSLASVGLHTTRDGLLQLDSANLDAAITKDAASVARLFVTDAKTGATGVMGAVKKAIDDVTVSSDSLIQAELSRFDTESRDITLRSDAMQVRVDAYQAQLRKQFADLEIQVSKWKSAGASLGSLGTTTNTTG